jgi:hypothetical protein
VGADIRHRNHIAACAVDLFINPTMVAEPFSKESLMRQANVEEKRKGGF